MNMYIVFNFINYYLYNLNHLNFRKNEKLSLVINNIETQTYQTYLLSEKSLPLICYSFKHIYIIKLYDSFLFYNF